MQIPILHGALPSPSRRPTWRCRHPALQKPFQPCITPPACFAQPCFAQYSAMQSLAYARPKHHHAKHYPCRASPMQSIAHAPYHNTFASLFSSAIAKRHLALPHIAIALLCQSCFFSCECPKPMPCHTMPCPCNATQLFTTA